MSETENIKNLYKPNYIQEKKFVRESRRLVSIKNGQLGYKVVFGNRKDIVDCRMKRYEDKVIKMRCITLNPYIFCRGMNVDKWISEYFSNSQWAKVTRQKIKKFQSE